MSGTLSPIVTRAGLSALINAGDDGLDARVAWLVLGDTGWRPDDTAAGLGSERQRVSILSGRMLSFNQLHLTAVVTGTLPDYWVREVGILLDDGTLLAIWSDPVQRLALKKTGVDLLLSFDFVLADLPDGNLVVDGTGGVDLPVATVAAPGVALLASQAESLAGTVTDRVITPAGTRVHGDARYATLDHSHDFASLTDRPAVFPPADHDHDTLYAPLTLIQTGRLLTTARKSSATAWPDGDSDLTHNYADVFPPDGYDMSHLLGVIPETGAVHFGGPVTDLDSWWLTAHVQADRIRIVGNVSENRQESEVIFLAIWRR